MRAAIQPPAASRSWHTIETNSTLQLGQGFTPNLCTLHRFWGNQIGLSKIWRNSDPKICSSQQDMEGGKLSWERWGCSECWSKTFRASLCVPQLSQGYSSHLSTWYINTEYIERSLGHQPSRDQQELCTARVPWVLNAPMILCWPHTQRWISVL